MGKTTVLIEDNYRKKIYWRGNKTDAETFKYYYLFKSYNNIIIRYKLGNRILYKHVFYLTN